MSSNMAMVKLYDTFIKCYAMYKYVCETYLTKQNECSHNK